MDCLDLYPRFLELIHAYVVQALWALEKPTTIIEDQKILNVTPEYLIVE